MAQVVLPTDCVRVAISGNYGESQWTNVWHAATAAVGDGDHADLLELLGLFVDAFDSSFLTEMNDNVSVLGAKARWKMASGAELEDQIDGSAVGGNSGDQTPGQVAVVINWHIDSIYRGGHPRTYLSGVTRDQVVNETHLSNAAKLAYSDAAAAFQASVRAISTPNVTALDLGCVRMVPNGGTGTFFPYVNATVRSVLGTQRRRLGGR